MPVWLLLGLNWQSTQDIRPLVSQPHGSICIMRSSVLLASPNVPRCSHICRCCSKHAHAPGLATRFAQSPPAHLLAVAFARFSDCVLEAEDVARTILPSWDVALHVSSDSQWHCLYSLATQPDLARKPLDSVEKSPAIVSRDSDRGSGPRHVHASVGTS